VKSVFFVYCVIKRIVDLVPKRHLLSKNASAIVITESEISNQCMLTVFIKSVLLRTKEQVQLACQFGLIDVTLLLHSPLHCRTSFTIFVLITSSSGTLSNVHHSSMLLVTKMTVGGGHMTYAHSP